MKVYIAVCTMIILIAYGARAEVVKGRPSFDEKTFSRQEMEAAYEEVRNLMGDSLKDLQGKRKSATEVARLSESLSWTVDTRDKNAKAVRFLLQEGAFNLYVEAGETDSAGNVLASMGMGNRYPMAALLELMHGSKSDFGVRCEDENCPLLISSIPTDDVRRRRHNVTMLTGLDILKFGAAESETGVENVFLDNHCYQFGPTKLWVSDCIRSRRGFARLNMTNSMPLKVDLYFTENSRRLYKARLEGGWGADVSRENAVRDFRKFVETIEKQWDVRTVCDVPADADNFDNQLAAEHVRALSEYKKRGASTGGSSLGLVSIEDFGVGNYRVSGNVFENIHHYKRMEVTITDEPLSVIAWEEGGGGRLGNSEEGIPEAYRMHYTNSVDFLSRHAEVYSGGRRFGRLGRGYEYGLYGLETNRTEAIRYYQLAAKNGNLDAQKRLRELGEPKMSESIRTQGIPVATNTSERQKQSLNDLTAQMHITMAMLDVQQLLKGKTILPAEGDKVGIGDVATAVKIKNNADKILKTMRLTPGTSREKYLECQKSLKKVIAAIDEFLAKDSIKLVAIVNGTKVSGAKVVFGKLECETPVQIGGLGVGDKFGPFEVRYERNGVKYAKRFSAIPVTWKGSKTFTCTLQKADTPPSAK